MYVATIPNRNSRPAILLRESYRENGKVKNRTLKNLSDWPAERVELLRAALRGDGLAPAGEGMEIERALPHGHVLAALGTARAIELDALLPRGKERRHQLALALIVARVLAPSAKLATARALDPATASHSLGAMLELGPVKVKELYATLDDGASYCSSRHVVDRSRKFCWRSSGDGHRERRRSAWRRISSRSMSACRMIQGAPLQCCSAGSVPSAMRRRMVD